MSAGLPERRPVPWAWLGRLPFARAARLQETVREAVLAGAGREALLFCEHDPVITLGRRADPAHIVAAPAALAARGIEVHHASRGGDVTYHGPGQLVGYPILHLRHGVRAHVEAMAAGVIDVLADLGVRAEWRPDRPGVWVGADKVCALGVHVRRRVAVHGFALNVTVDLGAFETIVPCGLADARVTSLDRLTDEVPTLPELAERVTTAFARTFGLSAIAADKHAIASLLDCKTEIGVATMRAE